MRAIIVAILLIAVGGLAAAGVVHYRRSHPDASFSLPFLSNTTAASPSPLASPLPSASPGASPSPSPSTSPSSAPVAVAGVDLAVDANGLSHATVVMNTTEGVIRFKFYTNDAPNTVNRFVELTRKGFYNGLTFHRVVPGFVIQGGDPTGTGTGGSGQKLKAEFNGRHHIEGAVAMARGPDPDSADSQFYITLSNRPDLDHHYTVFGQVIEGMDVIHRIKVGDKMITVTLN